MIPMRWATPATAKQDALAKTAKLVSCSQIKHSRNCCNQIKHKREKHYNITLNITQNNITLKYCIIIDDTCYPNPCQHEGYCVIDQETDYKCYCTHGFHGDNCQIGNRIVTIIS